MSKKKTLPSYFKDIREGIGWLSLLTKLGIKIYKENNRLFFQRTGNYITLCPFYKEKTPSLHFFNNSGQFYCFGCGRHGDIFDFVSKYVFMNDKIRIYHWFRKNYDIQLPWEN